jgi:hypothetical protein
MKGYVVSVCEHHSTSQARQTHSPKPCRCEAPTCPSGVQPCASKLSTPAAQHAAAVAAAAAHCSPHSSTAATLNSSLLARQGLPNVPQLPLLPCKHTEGHSVYCQARRQELQLHEGPAGAFSAVQVCAQGKHCSWGCRICCHATATRAQANPLQLCSCPTARCWPR